MFTLFVLVILVIIGAGLARAESSGSGHGKLEKAQDKDSKRIPTLVVSSFSDIDESVKDDVEYETITDLSEEKNDDDEKEESFVIPDMADGHIETGSEEDCTEDSCETEPHDDFIHRLEWDVELDASDLGFDLEEELEYLKGISDDDKDPDIVKLVQGKSKRLDHIVEKILSKEIGEHSFKIIEKEEKAKKISALEKVLKKMVEAEKSRQESESHTDEEATIDSDETTPKEPELPLAGLHEAVPPSLAGALKTTKAQNALEQVLGSPEQALVQPSTDAPELEKISNTVEEVKQSLPEENQEDELDQNEDGSIHFFEGEKPESHSVISKSFAKSHTNVKVGEIDSSTEHSSKPLATNTQTLPNIPKALSNNVLSPN